MLNSKQRSFLRALGNSIEPIIIIGKEGISEGIIKQADEALEAREILKASILKNSAIDARGACEEICEAIGADPVQVIGNKFIIYRKSKEKPSIKLP
jgi:RNA-binding protein